MLERWKSDPLPNSIFVELKYRCGNIISGNKSFMISCDENLYKWWSGYTDQRHPWFGLIDTNDFYVVHRNKHISAGDFLAYPPGNFYTDREFHVRNVFRWFCPTRELS